jgi:hypothetical protein
MVSLCAPGYHQDVDGLEIHNTIQPSYQISIRLFAYLSCYITEFPGRAFRGKSCWIGSSKNPKTKEAMRNVRSFFLTTCLCAILISGCDYPVVPVSQVDSAYTTRRFKFEAVVLRDNIYSGNCVEIKEDDTRSLLGLYCVETACNLTSEVRLKLNHAETRAAEHSEVEGTFAITVDSQNNLCGTYYGSGVRTDSLYEASCIMTTSMSRGIFYTEKTLLKLHIEGVFEQGNPKPVAYKVVISGHFRIPKVIN